MHLKSAKIENRRLVIDGEIGALARFANDFKEGDYEIKRKRPLGSLDANAYAWELIGKLADLLHADKNAVYLQMLHRYGQRGVVKLQPNKVELFKRQFPYCERHETWPQAETAEYWRFWVGSSHYDSKEMSIFIDGLVQECQDLGIETLTPAELARLQV